MYSTCVFSGADGMKVRIAYGYRNRPDPCFLKLKLKKKNNQKQKYNAHTQKAAFACGDSAGGPFYIGYC